MNTLEHAGYRARVELDAEDQIFVGRIEGISDIVGFHAETIEALEAAFREAVEDYVILRAKMDKGLPH